MGRPERPVDPAAGPVERLAWELRRLREEAGRPSYRVLAEHAHFSRSTLAEVATGMRLPTLEATLAYATACGGDREEWETRWREAAAEVEQSERRCPYPGLSPFQADDADLFFGRTRLADDLHSAVTSRRLSAVFGASGSGKSSLLRAGLLPRLTAGGTPVTVMSPGARPLDALADALGSLTGDLARGVLVIDQFEELFTLCSDERERQRFAETLAGLIEGDRLSVVLGVRADFYGHFAPYPGLVAALRDGTQLLIGPPSEGELREIIAGPARQVGLGVEPELVATVLAEARGQPGALPLVAHALRETWSRERSDTLHLAVYQETGGLRDAIARTAEELFGDLDEDDRAIVRAVFLRLTALGEGTEDTRRRADRDELTGISRPGEVDGILDRLAASRLVVTDHDTVEIAHEALIRAWPRLAGWLTTDREDLLLHRRLTEAAAEWDRGGRQDEYAYRGSRLAVWNGRDLSALNELETAFLEASRARREREHAAARRRVRLTVGGLSATAVIVSLLAVVAFVQAGYATDERDRAVSRQLAAGARAQLEANPTLALLLATEANRKWRTGEADMVLRQAIVDSRLRAAVAVPGTQDLQDAAFSQDGRRFATLNRRAVRVWNWDGRRLTEVRLSRAIPGARESEAMTFSPDGRHLAVGDADGEVELWDLTTGRDPVVLHGKRDTVDDVAFSSDGRRIAAIFDDEVRGWDLSRGKPKPLFRFREVAQNTLAFSHDGKTLFTNGIAAELRTWFLDGKRPRKGPEYDDNPANNLMRISPNGRWMATVGSDGAGVREIAGKHIQLPEATPKLIRPDDRFEEEVAFSPDGRRIATVEQNAVRIWTQGSETGSLALRFPESFGSTEIKGLSFSADGRTLTTVHLSGQIRVWDVASGQPDRRVNLPQDENSSFGSGRLSSDGQAWVTTNGKRNDDKVWLWNLAAGGKPIVAAGMRDHRNGSPSLAVSPGGRKVAAGGGEDGVIRLWESGRRGPPTVLRGGKWATALAFSDDGRFFGSGGNSGVRIWQAGGRHRLLATLPKVEKLNGNELAFSPVGQQLALGSGGSGIALWTSMSGQRPVVLAGHAGGTYDVEFSPDGRLLASSGEDGTIKLWKTAGQRDPVTVLRGRDARDLAFSPDGQWLASAHKDGTVRLWRLTGDTEAVVYTGFGSAVDEVAFTPDGKSLSTVAETGDVGTWRCEVCGTSGQMLELARKRALRKLTPQERSIYLG